MGYQAYAGNGLLDGITTGVGLRQRYDEMKRQRGLADGMRRVAEGDETGWQQVAENSPETYLQQKQWEKNSEIAQKQFNDQQAMKREQIEWERLHKNDMTPYQKESLALQRKQLEQNKLEKKFNTTNEIKNYNALVEIGVDPEKARDIAFKQMNNDPYARTMQIQEAKDRAELEHKIKQLESGIPEFQKMADKLNKLGEDATYTYLGRGWDAVARQGGYTTAGAKAREGYKQTVSNELLPTLRDTFGSQLSDSERESLLSTLGDIDLSPKEKRAAVDAFMEAKKRQLGKYKSELEKYGVAPKESTETPKKAKYTLTEIK